MLDVIKNLFNSQIGLFVTLVTAFIIIWVINKLLGDIILKILGKFYRKILQVSDPKSTINNKIQNIITDINSDLSDLRRDFNADRAFVIEFQNGEQFSSKFPVWKFSINYEKTKSNITYEAKELQKIPATLVWDDFLTIFFKDDNGTRKELPGVTLINKNLICSGGCKIPRGVYFFDVSKMSMDLGPFKAMLEKQSVSYLICSPIINREGTPDGIVGLSYCDENDYVLDDDLDFCRICKFAAQLDLTWQMNKTSRKKMLKIQEKLWNSNG